MKNTKDQLAAQQGQREAAEAEREQGTSGPWGMLPEEEVIANQEAGYEAGQ